MGIKVHRGGKRSPGGLPTKREPGYNEAGQRHDVGSSTWGTKHEFIGSGKKEYTFYSETRGTLTIKADDYWEALRLAKLRGYSRRQYRRKK